MKSKRIEIKEGLKYRHEIILTLFLQLVARLKVVTLEIYKEDGERKPLRLKGKVPDHIPFGVWVRHPTEDYNKKSPLAPIGYMTDGEQDNRMFYRHDSVFLSKRYIDCNLTVKENYIRENCFIAAKRIKKYIIN